MRRVFLVDGLFTIRAFRPHDWTRNFFAVNELFHQPTNQPTTATTRRHQPTRKQRTNERTSERTNQPTKHQGSRQHYMYNAEGKVLYFLELKLIVTVAAGRKTDAFH